VTQEQASATEPVIIARSEHEISRGNISDNALKVLYRLRNGGYEAHLVGGGVRDLSLGRIPKDFDVATDATPEDIKDLFRNCRLIGRRFRLAHVHFGPEVIEVATFRALRGADADSEDGDDEHVAEDGRILRDNVFGTLEEDALRRDFTINALYYNIADFSVVDYTGGMADLRDRLVRLIGDPETRYREDPVRMLRAVRFAVKLGFGIEARTGDCIPRLGSLLEAIPAARLFDEALKLFLSGQGVEMLDMLRRYDLLRYLFPQTDAFLNHDRHGVALAFIRRALENTDRRIAEDKPITPAFLFAAMLWPVVQARARAYDEATTSRAQAIQEAMGDIVERQLRTLTIPKRFGVPMREIWSMQDRLERYRGKRALRLLGHPRFRAAYDFYALRADAGDADPEVARFWTELQEAPEDERPARAGVKASASGGKAGAGGAKGKRKRRANGNKPAPEAADSGERDEPEQ
jgi:poly(A) polymerase